MLAPKDTFAELVERAIACGRQDDLPALVRAGLSSVPALRDAHLAVQAGVSAEAVTAILVSHAAPATPAPLAESRPDLPIRRTYARASFASALAAAAPSERKRGLGELDANLVARSPRRSMDSRVASCRQLFEAWAVPPFPVCWENFSVRGRVLARPELPRCGHLVPGGASHISCGAHASTHGASLGEGSHHKPARDLAQRGFPLLTGAVAVRGPTEHFSLDNATHVTDMLVFACWFMLCEIEIAGARIDDLSVHGDEVHIVLPLHKTLQGGDVVLKTRSLRCACIVRGLSPSHQGA